MIAGPVLASGAGGTTARQQSHALGDAGPLIDGPDQEASPSSEPDDTTTTTDSHRDQHETKSSSGDREDLAGTQEKPAQEDSTPLANEAAVSLISAGPESPSDVVIPEFSGNQTTDLLVTARDLVASLETRGGGDRRQTDAIEAINTSIEEYRADVFASSKDAYVAKRDAFTSLQPLANRGGNGGQAAEAQSKLATASNVSSRLALRQAVAAVRDHESELSPSQQNKIEAVLENAENRLEEGYQARHPSVITHYQKVWEQSQYVLDIVEKAVEPQLDARYGPAVERNGTFQTQLLLRLGDIRPFRYDSITLTFEDGSTQTVDLSTNQFANTAAIAQTEIDLGEQPLNQTVVASASSTRDPLRRSCSAVDCERTVETSIDLTFSDYEIIPERPAPDEFNEVEVEDEESGVTVEVGGEGLYEETITIQDRTPEEDASFRAGPVVRIENSTDIDTATVTIPIDDVASRDTENLSIYTWDPSDPAGWKQIETEIDTENGTATAEVDHFSFFSVFQIGEWDDARTSTITLEDRHVEGNLGNESRDGGVAKADFVFTIDTSGSMSGDKIRFARKAAKRFVGALFEDEEAGLVAFDGFASVRQPLTTDREALNRSISNLGARGGTDLPEGIRTGANLVANNGNENRTDEMILLADGQTDRGDPVSAARDAAEQGVTVNTVGLTSAVNNETLREVASVTGGDYYFVGSAEDLPETFDRIANENDVDLVDTSDNGIPDAVADADPKIPRLITPVWSAPTPADPRVNLNPAVTDTSGDGIPDADTIDVSYRVFEEDNETKLSAKVTSARHHPALIDTDGDGVSDKEETQITETRIEITQSTDDSLDFLNDFAELEDPTRAEVEALKDEYFESRVFLSNPFLTNTHLTSAATLRPYRNVGLGDQLDDGEKYELGLDPQVNDTTLDGVPDAVAVEKGWEPALYDYRPPNITIRIAEIQGRDFDFEFDGLSPNVELDTRNEYFVEGEIKDGSAITGWTVEIDGEPEGGKPEFGPYPQAPFWATVSADLIDEALDSAGGTKVEINTTDRHGNVARRPAITDSGIAGAAADTLDDLPGDWERTAGRFQGLSTGGAETVGGFVDLIFNFREKLAALRDIEIPDLAKIPDAIRYQQRLDNPYIDITEDQEVCGDVDSSDQEPCRNFRDGWYQGYLGWFVIEMVVGTKGSSKVVKGLDDLSDADSATIRRAANLALRANDAKNRAVRTTLLRLSGAVKRGTALPRAAAERLISAGKTVKQQYRINRGLRRLDTDQVRDLTPSQQRRVAQYLAEGGDPVVLQRLIDSPCDIPGAAPTGSCLGITSPVWDLNDKDLARSISRAVNRGDLEKATANKIATNEYRNGYRESIVDAANGNAVDADQIDSVVRQTEFLEPTKAANARQLISVSGSQGIKLIDDLDDAALRQLTDFQPNAVDTSRIERVVDRLSGSPDLRPGIAQLVADSGTAGFQLVDELGDTELRRFLEIDDSTVRAQLAKELTGSVSSVSTSVRSISQGDTGIVVRATTQGEDGGDIAVTARYLDDGEAYVRSQIEQNRDVARDIFEEFDVDFDSDTPVVDQISELAETKPGLAATLRGLVIEDTVLPTRLRNKYGEGSFSADPDGNAGSLTQGYIPEEDIPYDLSGSQQGIDGFAVDTDGNLVIIEGKAKNTNGRITFSNSDLENSGPDQLSQAWIEEKFKSFVQDAETPEQKSFITTLEEANYVEIDNGDVDLTDDAYANIKTELVFYQDGPPAGGLASPTLRKSDDETPTVDRFEAVKTGNIFDEIGSAETLSTYTTHMVK